MRVRLFRRLTLSLLAVSSLLGAVSAGAAQAGQPAPDKAEPAIRRRVEDYWKARATMVLQSVLPFYEPEFRAKYEPDVFARDFRRLNRFAPEFVGVDSVTRNGKQATIKVKLRTRPDVLAGEELVSVVEEVWLEIDGAWYRQSESLMPNI